MHLDRNEREVSFLWIANDEKTVWFIGTDDPYFSNFSDIFTCFYIGLFWLILLKKNTFLGSLSLPLFMSYVTVFCMLQLSFVFLDFSRFISRSENDANIDICVNAVKLTNTRFPFYCLFFAFLSHFDDTNNPTLAHTNNFTVATINFLFMFFNCKFVYSIGHRKLKCNIRGTNK